MTPQKKKPPPKKPVPKNTSERERKIGVMMGVYKPRPGDCQPVEGHPKTFGKDGPVHTKVRDYDRVYRPRKEDKVKNNPNRTGPGNSGPSLARKREQEDERDRRRMLEDLLR